MDNDDEIMEIGIDNSVPPNEAVETNENAENDSQRIVENNQQAEQQQETEEENENIKNTKDAEKTIVTTKRAYDSDSDDLDSDQTCPICMDSWTSSGEHRLCCLRCGHLFGYSCIYRWLQTSCQSGNRRCPQCNKKAAIKDIRQLYAKKLSSIDTTELDRLKEQLNNVMAEKNRLEMELSKCNLKQQLYERQIASLKSRILELETHKSELSIMVQGTAQAKVKKFHLEKSIEICKDAGCRVIDYNPWYSMLVVSQKSTNSLFAGYGLKKIETEKFQQRQFIYLHSQPIRDVTFHPIEQSLLLTVGFDKCIRLVDIESNVIVHTYNDSAPLWSCCWGSDNTNIFFTGAQNGSITQYDIRQTSGPVETMESPVDTSPLVSLASVPPKPGSGIAKGGFVACQLNSCHGYERKDSIYVPRLINLDGPFMSVRYNKKDEHILISSRPSAKHVQARHLVCTLERHDEQIIDCNVIHTFQAGSSQQFLSRPCHVNIDDETLIAAHQESTKSVSLWSVKTGKQAHSLPVSDPVIDMCSFETNNSLFLATL